MQSCSKTKRLKQLKERDFDILIIDEAHHAVAKTYQKIINELGFNKDKPLVSFMATPTRQDSKKLGNTFEKITYFNSFGTKTFPQEGIISVLILLSTTYLHTPLFSSHF